MPGFIRDRTPAECGGAGIGLAAGIAAPTLVLGPPKPGPHAGGALWVMAVVVAVPLSVMIFSSIGKLISGAR